MGYFMAMTTKFSNKTSIYENTPTGKRLHLPIVYANISNYHNFLLPAGNCPAGTAGQKTSFYSIGGEKHEIAD
jgi:hypothetical protein